VNETPTRLDRYADMRFEKLEQVFEGLNELLA
jgi:hypothetical protein